MKDGIKTTIIVILVSIAVIICLVLSFVVGKKYSDMSNNNIWIDDIVVVDATLRKYYSVLPRVEIDLHYANQLCNHHQYKAMINRKDFTEGMNVNYFGGK